MQKRLLATVIVASAAVFAAAASRQRAVLHPANPPAVAGPTFTKEVVRIFQQNCQTCHHPGDIAPFSLMTYAQTKPEAFNIKYMVQTHQMPPWKPVDGCSAFAEPRVISQSDIDTLVKWVDNGAPEGNPADLPAPRDFSSGWALGQPDLVLTNPDPYTPPSSGDMYRCFTLPSNLPADSYVSAIDVHPGDRGSVHHVIAYIDTTGASVGLDDKDPGPGYTSFGGPGFDITDPSAAALGGWAPGYRPIALPDDVAYLLPAHSRVVLQVHYHPHGAPSADQTSIGIYFAKRKPKQLLRLLPLVNNTFTIPAGNPAYNVAASFFTPVAAHLWLIAPHMHLLGRRMTVTASLPSGAQQCLITINDWDFNWQGLYRFVNPVAVPPFTVFNMLATFDNSADNPKNPNFPPRPVSWGESTTDEMAISFIGFTIDSENLATGQQANVSWMPPFPAGTTR
jgi:hypothetical protein